MPQSQLYQAFTKFSTYVENSVYNFGSEEMKITPMYIRSSRKRGSWNRTDNLVERYVDKMWITFSSNIRKHAITQIRRKDC